MVLGIRINKVNNFDTSNKYYDIIMTNNTLKSEIVKLNSEIDSIKYNNNLILNYLKEKSSISNEKRISIFKLKTYEDSILINFLMDNIESNKNIIKHLQKDWNYNEKTNFIN